MKLSCDQLLYLQYLLDIWSKFSSLEFKKSKKSRGSVKWVSISKLPLQLYYNVFCREMKFEIFRYSKEQSNEWYFFHFNTKVPSNCWFCLVQNMLCKNQVIKCLLEKKIIFYFLLFYNNAVIIKIFPLPSLLSFPLYLEEFWNVPSTRHMALLQCVSKT